MQRIANLIIKKDNQVLLLKKPRRDWYVAPGGKMEPGESIFEAANREFTEETNATPLNAHLKGIYTMVIKEGQQVIDEWMLYTFLATDYTGVPLEENREGILEWHPVEALHTLPMAEGDRTNLLFAVNEAGMQYGTFEYTADFELLSEKIQQSHEA